MSVLFLHVLYKANLAYNSLAYPNVGLLKAGAHFNIYGHRDPLPDNKMLAWRNVEYLSNFICQPKTTTLS